MTTQVPDATSPESHAARPRRRRLRRWLAWTAILLLVLLVGGELFARFYLGLGDPPLMVSDPEIEYLFKPNGTYRRFGNHIHYNAYSMRSEDFPPHATDARELRVLLVGDSVINGGAQTDDADLASRRLEKIVGDHLGRPVIVGNISAGSWGPPNELAYLKRYGLFDAQVVVIVLSSHDFADVPSFEPIVGTAGYPDRRPWSALEEGWTRYKSRLWYHAPPTDSPGGPPPPNQTAAPKDIEASLAALREMIRLAQEHGAKVIVAQHLETGELNGHEYPGHQAIIDACRASGIEPIQLGKPMEDAVARGEKVYRDIIHPTAAGQAVIAQALAPAIEETLRERSSTTQSSATHP